MATGDKAEMRAALEITLGDAAGSEWTDPEKDNAIDEAVDDVTRLMPRERINETVYRITTTDETFTSSHNTFVTLDNKPIKKGSTVVTNSAGTTTYDEYDDYEMDYANGQIKVLSTGDMANSTSFKIDYTIDVPSIDVSGITDLMVPLRVEWPIDSVPKSFASFMHFEDQLILTTKGTRGQASIGDKDHVRLYYYAEHTPPTSSAAGTYPRWLDAIVVKGALAYCLFIKARKLYLESEVNANRAQTQLVKQDANSYFVGITAGFADANISFDRVKPALDRMIFLGAGTEDALGFIRGTPGSLVETAITALDKVATHSAEANSQITAQRVLRGDISAAATANSGRNTNFSTTAHGLQTGDIVVIERSTDYNGKWIVTKIDDNTFQINGAFAADRTGQFHRESQVYESSLTLDKIPAELLLLHTALDAINSELSTATRNADDYLNTGDALINQINTGVQPAVVNMQFAQTKIQMAQTFGQEALGRAQHTTQLANETITRLAIIQRVLESANSSLAVSGSYITEAQTRKIVADTVISEAQLRINHGLEAVEEARLHVTEGLHRLSTVQQYVQLSEMHIAGGQSYVDLARQFNETADRFLTDARERHRDYIRHLTARVEQARPRSQSSSRQWADSNNNRITAPTGSET